jgi:hypothetical protein
MAEDQVQEPFELLLVGFASALNEYIGQVKSTSCPLPIRPLLILIPIDELLRLIGIKADFFG